VTIKALAPLLVSERRPDGQFRPSSSYIPGAVWRGALAQQFINEGRESSDDFRALFVDADAPLFRNAFPALDVAGNGAEQYEGSRPLPATAYSCKAEGGFERHGVYDSLLDRLCCEEFDVPVPYQPRCNHEEHARHDDAGTRVEAFSGFHVNSKKSVSPPTHLTTRVAINRRRKVAEPNLLYSPLVISETDGEKNPTVFCASLVVGPNKRAMANRALEGLEYIGSGSSRGFGHVKVVPDDLPEDGLDKRVSDFNARARERWRLWKQVEPRREPLHTPDTGTFFTVLLLADAILRPDGWTPSARLTPDILGEELQDATLLRCYATAEYRGGWNTAWGLPKDTELVARMGSAYVYHTPRKADDQSLLQALGDLETKGVGERRVEGFGHVRVCDEFHLRIQENRTREEQSNE
jgi:CRISPR-associated protein Csx10